MSMKAKALGALAGFRLIDGVVIAAVALLALKAMGLFSGMTAPGGPGELPSFGRVFAHARTNYVPPDVSTTGTIAAKGKSETQPGAGDDKAPASEGPALARAPSPGERALLERLGERRDELQQKARDMETRERVMDDAEKKLDQRINQLKSLEEKATAEVAKRQESEPIGLKNIIVMYEAMKPKEAARVFDRLPHAVLVPVATQMNPRKMAEVMAAMTPESAERLTVALANRSRAPSAEAAPVRPALPPGELPSIEPSPPLRR